MADLKINNNALLSRFESLVNGKLALLDYRIEQGTIFLRYVEVPVEEQGRGIASKVTQAALKFARDNGLTVVPHCPFIASYVSRHPEELKVR